MSKRKSKTTRCCSYLHSTKFVVLEAHTGDPSRASFASFICKCFLNRHFRHIKFLYHFQMMPNRRLCPYNFNVAPVLQGCPCSLRNMLGALLLLTFIAVSMFGNSYSFVLRRLSPAIQQPRFAFRRLGRHTSVKPSRQQWLKRTAVLLMKRVKSPHCLGLNPSKQRGTSPTCQCFGIIWK